MNMEKVVKEIEDALSGNLAKVGNVYKLSLNGLKDQALTDALAMLKEQEKEIKALRLLVEWAEECDFGFDQFPDEYERYKEEIKDMKYIDGMIHVARRTLEDHGAFET